MELLIATTLAHTLSGGQVWVHTGKPAQVIELFTSQGCSSCPPADKYLSKLKTHPDLWRDVIPLAYHVDYWNRLGWKDEFSQPQFSQLQRLYHAYDVVSSVYTPGFVIDGKEWRGFFNWFDRKLPLNLSESAPQLTLIRKDQVFVLSYQSDQLLDATIVFVSSGHKTSITAGENKGKDLDYNFVVLDRQQARTQNGTWTFKWHGDLSDVDVVAAWVSEPGGFTRIQTVAGKIE